MNVPLSCGSHLDAGWLQTFGQYYEGKVQHILDTLIPALEKGRHRKFSWVEVSCSSGLVVGC